MINNLDCNAINSHVNKITSATNGKQATGWKIYASTAYSSKKKRSSNPNEYWQKKCSNGGKNWWGWCDGLDCGAGKHNLGKIETTLKGCGTARLDFGNCNDLQCQVDVYVDGRRISTANKNTPHKVVQFDFKNGSKLKITEGEEFLFSNSLI